MSMLCQMLKSVEFDSWLPAPLVVSVVQDDAQKDIVDVNFADVFDEAQFPEFVHEEIDPRPGGPDHRGQHLLRYLGGAFA